MNQENIENIENELEKMINELKTKKKKKNNFNTDLNSSSTSTSSSTLSSTSNYSYEELLTLLYDKLKTEHPELITKKRILLETPKIARLNTSKIVWTNFFDICETLKREQDHVFKFFLAELGTNGSINGNKQFIIKGIYLPKYIESLLRKYIKNYVLCSGCKGIDTKIIKDTTTRLNFINCLSCYSSRSIQDIQSGYHALSKGERRK